MESNTYTLLIWFVGFTGLAVFLQACVLFAIFISLRKTASSVERVTEDLKATVVPMVHSSRELLERITPQVITVTEGLAELTAIVKKETSGVSLSASEIMARLNHQTERLDALLTQGLNSVERAGAALESTVAMPVRQVNGIMAGIRAMVDTYRSIPSRRSRQSSEDDPDFS